MIAAGLGLLALVLPNLSRSQIACFNYGSMLSCDGPRGNTIIAPLGPSGGVIHGDRDGRSFMEPYTVFPPSSSREAFSSSGSLFVSPDVARDSYTSGSRPYESSARDSYTSGSRPYERESSSSRESYSSRPIEPLRSLDRLDRLDGWDRSDPLSDPLLPLLLGE